MKIYNFIIAISAILLSACSLHDKGAEPDSGAFNAVKDIDVICEYAANKYPYYAPRSAYWAAACDGARQAAAAAEDRWSALPIIERLIDDLYDPHISLNANNQNSPRLLPSSTDMWAERQGDGFFVTALRPSGSAANMGVKINDKLLSFNGTALEDLALTRITYGQDHISRAREHWAVNAALAGRRSEPRQVKILRGDEVLTLDLGSPEPPPLDDLLSFKKLDGNIGYIRLHNSLGMNDSVAAFNQALEALKQTKGLILDLRDTPGGGNTGVAEPIMGRFIRRKTAYQRTVPLKGKAVDRMIKPKGPWTYTAPVAVLAGRWTGSMGEGLTIGFDAMERGEVLGSPMAGLAGGTYDLSLPQTGLSLRLPAYDLHHLDGTPRHEWRPRHIQTTDNGNGPDTLLGKAVQHIESQEARVH